MHPSTLLFALFGTAIASESNSAASLNTTTSLVAAFGRPDGAANIDLEGLVAERITKRKAMTYCANQDSTNGDCEPLDDLISSTLAASLKGKSNQNDCSSSSGSVQGFSYSFYTAPSSTCDTTAERGTIQGGLNRYFDYLGGQLCGVHCVRLNHGGGTYRAYITLGPEGADLGSVDCSSSAVYVDCGNGGQNDS
ncbi:hypothetical protein QM012_002134 [Aureobasidium pullulans]|uniref:Secreted protein CSS2 C-terminal domain-containing protein n=1 Tax=Aureobasidium pullulans TaxID=5580 RepID=A0ABR0TBM2_AURPU